MTVSRDFVSPTNLRGASEIRGPMERHIRALQNRAVLLGEDVESILGDLSNYLPLAGGQMSGELDMKNQNVRWTDHDGSTNKVGVRGDNNGVSLDLGRTDGTNATPFIDFHGGDDVDRNARIILGGNQSGLDNGSLTITAHAGLVLNANTGGLTGSALWTLPWGVLGFVKKTSSQALTSSGDLTDMSVTVTVGTNRVIKISANAGFGVLSPNARWIGDIMEGSTIIGRFWDSEVTVNNQGSGFTIMDAPSAGSHTYKLAMREISGSATVTVFGDSGSPLIILVEDIGPT